MGDYDKVIKENIEAIFLPLLSKFTGIEIAQSTPVKDKIQRTLEREPDFLNKITDTTGNEFILQLEFQSQDDPEMVYRMAEYKALLQRKYQLPVKQLVIYLGAKSPKMRTQLPEEERIIGFQLANINRLHPAQLTNSDIPEEVILSILSDFNPSQADEIITSIINKLKLLSNTEVEFKGYVQQLIILSRLRKLESRTEEKAENMPITYDITTDGLYLKGIEQKQYSVVKKALANKKLSLEEIADLAEVDIDYVITVQSELKSAE